MNDYIEVRFDVTPCSQDATDLLAAILAEKGFDSFVPDEKGLFAYIPAESFNDDLLSDMSEQWPFDSAITHSYSLIPGQDWNSEWEKNYFKPIVIDGKCVIHSSFHRDYPECIYDIVIDPKMAFGTGHHDTTSLMIRQLLQLDLNGKKVIDMGTGTGILAILACKLGASKIVAVEIDPVAYENTLENIRLNDCESVDVVLGGAEVLRDYKPEYDVFLANINRNVILEDLDSYLKTLTHGGKLIISGFLKADIEICTQALEKAGLTDISVLNQNEWVSISAIYP